MPENCHFIELWVPRPLNVIKCFAAEDFETSTPVETNDVVCSEEGPNVYPIQSSCTEYYMCDNNTAFKVKCPKDLLMNADKLTCDYPENVDCGKIFFFVILHICSNFYCLQTLFLIRTALRFLNLYNCKLFVFKTLYYKFYRTFYFTVLINCLEHESLEPILWGDMRWGSGEKSKLSLMTAIIKSEILCSGDLKRL